VTIPPGSRLPRAAQTLAWTTRPLPWLERLRARYGDVFTVRIAHEGTWVMLADPEAVKEVFTGDATALHAGEANAVLRPILGHNSVLLLDEAPHLRQRRLLLPPLHGERMQRYGALMERAAEAEISTWPAGVPVRVHPHMQAVTLEVILRAVFGSEEGAEHDALRTELRRLLEDMVDVRTLLRLALLGPDRVSRLPSHRRALAPVDRIVLDVVRRRRDARDLEERDDILSLLLQARHEDGSAMSDAELRDELVTLLLAGHETTATALSWAVERLVRHPDAWERLRSGDEAWVDAVVKETLRLRPVLPIVARKLTRPLTVRGWDLPAGVTVAPCIHLVHRRPDVYPEPSRFRPERFLERPAGTYTWIPFGGGVRRCLGASFALFEMQAVLRVLARMVDLRPTAPEGERVSRRSITLVPARGGEVRVVA